MWSLSSLAELSLWQALIILGVLLPFALFDLRKRSQGIKTHLLAGCIAGSLLSLVLIQIGRWFGTPIVAQSPYAMALAILLLIGGWKALFGPWETGTKATMLGVFIFWIAYYTLSQQSPEMRTIQLYSIGLALVPAAVWCLLFLKYHAERIGVVLLMFFSGMLSTVPILFYDLLVRRGAEFQFFLFRITPESFSQSSHGFVTGQLATGGGTQSLIMTSLVSFMIVGIIEEISKFWALSHSGKPLLRSIDDGIELAIIVAIGFAFAENIVNPAYFGGFVRDFLMKSQQPDVLGFFSNMLGRSVLTTMVHILSTGIMGYALGLSVFAGPYLSELEAQHKPHPLLSRLHAWFGVRELTVYRTVVLTTGIVLAIVLHGMFNFMVTLPDMLPWHPRTLGELTGMTVPLISAIPLLLIPAMLYVVGGFWLLTSLCLRRENAEDRGHRVAQEVFVRD